MVARTRRRVVDLAHEITDGMVTYPGIPAPALGSHLSFDESVERGDRSADVRPLRVVVERDAGDVGDVLDAMRESAETPESV